MVLSRFTLLQPKRLVYFSVTYPCVTYWLSCRSKSRLLETPARNGLCVCQSLLGKDVKQTYNKPVNVLSVDIDEVLNAGHVVDPAREIQFSFCAQAVDASRATALAMRV